MARVGLSRDPEAVHGCARRPGAGAVTRRSALRCAPARNRAAASILLLIVSGAGACSPAGHPDAPVSNAGEQPMGEQVMTQGAAGLVVNDAGAPLAGAFLQPRPLDAPHPPIPEIAILSGEDGRFQCPLPPGNYEITVVLEGYESVTRRVNVLPGDIVALDLVLKRTGGQL